jgi:hypothetical protein
MVAPCGYEARGTVKSIAQSDEQSESCQDYQDRHQRYQSIGKGGKEAILITHDILPGMCFLSCAMLSQ